MTCRLASWTATDGTVIALDGSAGVTVMRGAAGLDGPPVANTLDARINAGSVLVHQRRPARAFTLPLMVDTNVISEGEVISLFQGGTLTADSGRELREVIHEAGLEGVWSVDSGGVTGLSHRKFAVSLLALDPWWYGATQSVSGTFAAGTAWDAAIAWDADIPWNGGDSVSVVNMGDAATPVLVVVTGQADEVSMSVDGVGGWTTAAAISSGAYLSVNGVPNSPPGIGPHRGPHGQFAGSDLPIDWSLLTPGSQLFELPPGESSLIVGATNTDGNSAWRLVWSPRYLSP